MQIPKIVQSEFNMDSNQLLRVGVNGLDLCSGWQFFYAKMGKDGRIFIPKLTLSFLKREKPNLSHQIMEIMIDPAQSTQLEDNR